MRYHSSEKIKPQITQSKLSKKIVDSLVILSDLLAVLYNDSSLYDNYIQQYLSVNKYYIVLVDISLQENPLEHLAIGLEFLSENSSMMQPQIIKLLSEELADLPDQIKKMGTLVEKLQPPLLKSCSKIDGYYEQLSV